MADTKQRISEGSLELFSQKGFSAVSIRDICGKVKIKENTVYYHIKNKQAIFDELLLQFEKKATDMMAQLEHRLTMKSFSVEGEFYKNVYDIFFECYFMDDFCNRVMSMCTRFIEWRHSFLLSIKEAVRLRMIKKACLRQQIGMQSFFFPKLSPARVDRGFSILFTCAAFGTVLVILDRDSLRGNINDLLGIYNLVGVVLAVVPEVSTTVDDGRMSVIELCAAAVADVLLDFHNVGLFRSCLSVRCPYPCVGVSRLRRLACRTGVARAGTCGRFTG